MVALLSPYLIQRGRIRKQVPPHARLSDAVGFDYMGASEFEYGALPDSLRVLAARAAAHPAVLALSVLDGLADRDGRPLLCIGLHPGQAAEYQTLLLGVIGGRVATKERADFEDMVSPVEQLPSWHALRREPPRGFKRGEKRAAWESQRASWLTTLWWDITNSVFCSFETDFMEGLPAALRRSWGHMGIPCAPTEPAPAEDTLPAPAA